MVGGYVPGVEFDTKVAVVLREDLAVWQKANVTAFLLSGIAGNEPDLVGESYIDGSGNRYLPMLKQPILVYAADGPGIRRAYERAMQRGVTELAISTYELCSTPHDEANRAAVAAVPPTSSTSSASASAPIGRRSIRCSTACAPTPSRRLQRGASLRQRRASRRRPRAPHRRA